MAAAEPRILPVRNPRTGQIDMHITAASPAEIAAECARLRQSQPAWANAPLAHRAALIEADSIDTGYGQISRVAPDMVIGTILRMAQMAPVILEQARRKGKSPISSIHFDTNLRPYPIAGIIAPWNAPLMLSTLHAISPLFAGCAVIVKPSEVTPRFVKPMMETI